MEVLIKVTVKNVSFIAITFNDDNSFYLRQFCSFNNITFLGDDDDMHELGVFCKKNQDWHEVYSNEMVENEFKTNILYELVFIKRDTMSPFHKIL